MNRTIQFQYKTLSVIITLILMLLPFLIWKDFEKAFTIGLSLVGTASGVIGAMYAYLIYRNLGIDRLVIDRQVNTVINFLDEIRSVRIRSLSFKDGELHSFSHLTFEKYSTGYLSASDTHAYHGPVIFISNNLYSAMHKLNKLRVSVWMPPEIAEKLKFVELPAMPVIQKSELGKTENYKTYVKVLFPEFPDMNADEHLITFPQENFSFIQFHNEMYNLIQVCKKWIEDNASLPIPLNM